MALADIFKPTLCFVLAGLLVFWQFFGPLVGRRGGPLGQIRWIIGIDSRNEAGPIQGSVVAPPPPASVPSAAPAPPQEA